MVQNFEYIISVMLKLENLKPSLKRGIQLLRSHLGVGSPLKCECNMNRKVGGHFNANARI